VIAQGKDPTLKTFLLQQALQARGFYHGALDNWWGTKSERAYQQFRETILIGDGTWAWVAEIDGADIVIEDATMSWFGGEHDRLDNGRTASGVDNRKYGVMGCALPVIPGVPSTHGSPLAFENPDKRPHDPGIPWNTPVSLSNNGSSITLVVPLIDNGPAKWAGDQVDAPPATFEALGGKLDAGILHGVTVRILGAAKYVTRTL
jgi:hypothetical protein